MNLYIECWYQVYRDLRHIMRDSADNLRRQNVKFFPGEFEEAVQQFHRLIREKSRLSPWSLCMAVSTEDRGGTERTVDSENKGSEKEIGPTLVT